MAPSKLANVFLTWCCNCLQASVTCALTGPLQIKDYKAIAGAEGHEVFSERKGLNLFQNKVTHWLLHSSAHVSCICAHMRLCEQLASLLTSMLVHHLSPLVSYSVMTCL